MNQQKDDYFDLLLSNYLETKLRVDNKLNDLLYFCIKMKEPSHQCKRKSHLFKAIRKQKDPFKILKMAMLVHWCVLAHTVRDCEEMLGEFEKSSGSGKKGLVYIQDGIISQYLWYLQKRLHMNATQHFEDEGKNVEIDPITKCYQLLNLLKTGTAFSNCMLTLFRYYGPKNGFILDFNITLAKDFR